MKKQYILWAIVIVAIVIIGGVWLVRSGSGSSMGGASGSASSTSSVSPTETTKLSSSLSKYENQELGFSVSYPSDWQTADAPAGVTFYIPDQFPQTTIGTFDATIQVLPGTCAFPPVVTVQNRSTMKVGSLSFDTISMQNSVQGNGYYDDLYSLQKGNVCYMFTFESVTVNPTTKGFSSSDVAKITANNQSHINDADAAFKAVVQSFGFVAPAVGQPETSYHPATTTASSK